MSTAETTVYSTSLYDGDDANGVANVVSTLLGQNLANFPARVKTAKKMSRPVTIYSTDTETACTIVFGTEEAVVYNDVVGKPSVTVMATVDQILDVSQLQMKAGGLVPVGFFTKRGMGVLGQILAHKLVVKGLLSHTVASLRTIALLSVVDS
ncbi:MULTISPECIES: hypothetical protein [unclassified Gordonia (in: high G+C Gram-positive bacteria)]|uniref:hypothetical protein n=1 Tax=unclassified Gordonia (in: high G+C Gram-positive bacteria) TaxID=2657482 RepID=UPI0009ABCDF9|nr:MULTISPECIES: hypothetical protein [unclassified Gordonia (in: high G+C Gram-positive bacteria)]MDF3281093.1 hypothetical protein [Gordonia sp. N1V]OPX14998.1 hypothetical protein B1964_12310 [Gordonia sp. i37]